MCRKLKGKLGTQEQRIQNVPPFSYSGLDIFGPFTMKYRRTELNNISLFYLRSSSRAVYP